jgi:hypothetical protein
MLNAPMVRKVTVLLLLAVLAAPWASAAASQQTDARPVKVSPLELLSRFWTFVTSVWSDEGCRIDPNGGCVPEPQEEPDTGCRIDPNGGCAS